MRIVKVTHADIKGQDVFVDIDQLTYWYFSPALNATVLVAAAGAVMKVSESVEQITNLKNQGEKKCPTKQKNKTL